MAKPKGNSEKVCNKNANGQNDVTRVLIEGAWQGWGNREMGRQSVSFTFTASVCEAQQLFR